MTAQHITARPYGMYASCEIYSGRIVYGSSIAGCARDLLNNIPQRSPRAAGICTSTRRSSCCNVGSVHSELVSGPNDSLAATEACNGRVWRSNVEERRQVDSPRSTELERLAAD